ncbi:membrane protein [Hoeflea marina]|uniref:Membrane protein n=2 Tax=Hoeflea marina TaxID=274592 RepID=A0A317PXN5_9HYPH|nr:membrane protein [Hoeflea marina]
MGWWLIGRRTVESFFRDRVMLVSAGVTLYVLLAMVPALSIVVSLYGLVSDRHSIAEQLALVERFVPEGGMEILRDQLVRLSSQEASTLSWAVIIAVLISLWSASLGVKGLFEAMNVAYGEQERRSFLHVTGLAFLFTLGGAVLAALALASVVILPWAISFMPVDARMEWVVRALSFMGLALGTVLGLSAIYRWGPDRRSAKWRWVTPGAVFATVSVMTVSAIFSWYVSNFANYSASYGSLGAPIGFLTWLWISVIVVVTGGELNSEVERQTAIDTTLSPDKPMGERGAYVADTLGD